MVDPSSNFSQWGDPYQLTILRMFTGYNDSALGTIQQNYPCLYWTALLLIIGENIMGKLQISALPSVKEQLQNYSHLKVSVILVS